MTKRTRTYIFIIKNKDIESPWSYLCTLEEDCDYFCMNVIRKTISGYIRFKSPKSVTYISKLLNYNCEVYPEYRNDIDVRKSLLCSNESNFFEKGTPKKNTFRVEKQQPQPINSVIIDDQSQEQYKELEEKYKNLEEKYKELEEKYLNLLQEQLQYFVKKDKFKKEQNQRAYQKRLEKIKCKSEWCNTIGTEKYEGYCMPCFVKNPENNDKPVVRNYKTKEKDVADRIKQTFENFSWIADRRVEDGCSRRRPDLLLDMGSHVIIIEVDENKHSNYDCSCENKRIMEISRDLQHRPIVFIRFNPDDYIKDGKTVKSCWKLNKRGVMQIEKHKEKEWEERITVLKEQIQYWINNTTNKTIETIELFYN